MDHFVEFLEEFEDIRIHNNLHGFLIVLVILDHSYKKNKVNEYLKSIAEFESSSEFYLQKLTDLENEFQNVNQYLKIAIKII